jgi:putative Mg2+ transporter-C (MgtC) family protein
MRRANPGGPPVASYLSSWSIGVSELDMCLRILAAAGFGMVIGAEREAAKKPAGLRTHLLVSTAAALLTTTSLIVGEQLNMPGEALRVAAGVVTGIGFIGAGTILQTERSVVGLTTAATVFMAAAIGIAAGAACYYLALSAAAITILSTWVLLPLEHASGRNLPDEVAGPVKPPVIGGETSPRRTRS